MFNFIKKIALSALSFFLLRIFFSRTKSFIDIDVERTNYCIDILLTERYVDTNYGFFIDCSNSEYGECSALLEGRSRLR